MKSDWRKELEQGGKARAVGNEGRARVCARRAAGAVAGEFLVGQGVRLRSASVLEALQKLENWPDLEARLRLAASRLTARVGENFDLPEEVDLLVEARLICERFSED